ncbi:MAG: kynurenine 3-monooxygenase [Ectothiorhodospiraceae bacterium]|nr:kynurenine 3-monooxygenase [Ectothiorhodospiraceae bacterium]
MKQQQHVLIAGAGLAGSLLAIYLAKQGFKVSLFERRPDMRTVDISAGRSINLALSTRGIHALRETGVLDEIMEYALPMKGRLMHSVGSELTFQPYGRTEDEVIYSISRGGLNISLMNAAEGYENVSLYFNKRGTDVDPERGELQVTDEVTGAVETHSGDVIIGTDGAGSAVRSAYFSKLRFNYSQDYLEHGYKELTIPPAEGGGFRIREDVLHIWPRHSYMLIALPNADGSFTCTLFFPYEGEASFAALDNEKKVTAFFKEQFPDAVPHMPTLAKDFFDNPTGSLATVRCSPWDMGGKALILGDASHAIVPFFGQGMNCAFEDCTVLNDLINEHGSDWAKVFPLFTESRKPNADAIADMALDNFIEMRDKTADEAFLLRKELEKKLEERFPKRFVPKYSMVTFHRIPYAIAQQRGKIQNTILEDLADGIDEADDVDWNRAEMLITNRLTELQDDIIQ